MNSQDELYQQRVRFSGITLVTVQTHQLYQFLPVNDDTAKAYGAALAFIDDDKRPHHFLTYAGKCGVGKSHLAIGIGWFYLANTDILVRYHKVEALLDIMRREYDEIEALSLAQRPLRKTALQWAKSVHLLILDDLGAEKRTVWAGSKLDEIIDHRYENGFLTVITTNLAADELPERISSRIRGGTAIAIEATDYRLLQAKARKGGANDPS